MDAERGARGPRGPEAAGFEADENGSTEGELRELLAGAEAAMAVNLERQVDCIRTALRVGLPRSDILSVCDSLY